MGTYYLAPSLAQFRAEINLRWPRRDRESDGWIGDTAHSARKSDHNPDWPRGVVRALDIDKDGLSPAEVLAAAMAHPAVNYIIWSGRIYSRARGFKPVAYTGINGHYHHIHVSLLHSLEAETTSRTWFGPAQQNTEDEMTQAQYETLLGTIHGYGRRIENTESMVRGYGTRTENIERTVGRLESAQRGYGTRIEQIQGDVAAARKDIATLKPTTGGTK